MGSTYTIARNLAAKKVITNSGQKIGSLSDLVIDEVSGSIEKLLIEVNMDSKIIQKLGPDGKIIEVPWKAVRNISDFIIIDERELLAAPSA
ncbi:MAG: hypothetical protein GOV15_00740 [Candidatus Diapherotrites archaeon]|nr:hypothetical protein [Candidatus Diapherotrites archaeon]